MNRCPRCEKVVYYAEEVIALGQHWHKSCFLCGNVDCRKRLDSSNCSDHAGDAYCSHCHRKMFGPKGYGYGMGAGTLSMETIENHDRPNHYQSAAASAYHTKTVGQSSTTAPLLELNGAAETGGGRATSALSSVSSSSLGGASSLSGGGGPPLRGGHSPGGSMPRAYLKQLGGPDVCGRCGKVVYLAERMMGGGAAWHKMSCFTCQLCNKRLESTSLCEKDGELYCKTCYGRNYGPKGYGFGIGAGTLQMQQ